MTRVRAAEDDDDALVVLEWCEAVSETLECGAPRVVQFRRPGCDGSASLRVYHDTTTCTTGWKTWPVRCVCRGAGRRDASVIMQAAHCVAELLASAEACEKVIGRASMAGARVLEVSAGTGLVSLAAAASGARVVATDIASQLPLISRNVDANGFADRVTVRELQWGYPIAGEYDIGFCVEALFVAMREGLAGRLMDCIVAMTGCCERVVFAYYERRAEDEHAWLGELASRVHLSRVDAGTDLTRMYVLVRGR